MYGIAGIVAPSQVSEAQLLTMTASENAANVWLNEKANTGLASTNANQQYLHYTIVLDGELYNTKALYTELKNLGYMFPIGNDESLVMAAFDQWRERCMEHLDGAFVFAIYDAKKQEMFLARDRLGEKQLYYHADFRERGRFAQLLFSSEMQALWRVGAPKNMDGTMALNYLTLGYTSNPNKKMATFYSDILSLPAGHYLRVVPSEGRIQMRCWYRPSYQYNENISETDALKVFETALKTSVGNRLKTNDNIGLIGEDNLNNISIEQLIKEKDGNIPRYTQKNNADYNIEKDFQLFCQLQEEPIADMETFFQFQNNRNAYQQKVSVLYDMLGADEILGGKDAYVTYYLQYLLKKDYSLFWKEKQLFQQNGFLPKWKFKNYYSAFATEKTTRSAQNQLVKTQVNFPFLNEQFLLRYHNPDILRQPEIRRPEDAMYFDIFTRGIESQLKCKAKNARAFSLKLRYPFLQYQLVELLFSLPSHFKFKDGYNQWLLRKYMENHCPQNITWQHHKPQAQPALSIPTEMLQTAIHKLVDAKILRPKILEIKTENLPLRQQEQWRIVCLAYFIWRNMV
ncbi:MAG: asparagine synthase-related protein [Chitinophagaceae bacterium]